MKITSKLIRLGKDIKFVYDTLDQDKSGSLERDELLNGLKNSFNVYFSVEEIEEVTKYLDEDGSGGIEFNEFY